MIRPIALLAAVTMVAASMRVRWERLWQYSFANFPNHVECLGGQNCWARRSWCGHETTGHGTTGEAKDIRAISRMTSGRF